MPGEATADRLIRDKLADGDWHTHVSNSPRCSSTPPPGASPITGRLVSTSSAQDLASGAQASGDPTRRAADPQGHGPGDAHARRAVRHRRDIDEAPERTPRARENKGFTATPSTCSGRGGDDGGDAERYFRDLRARHPAIGAPPRGAAHRRQRGISVKLSARIHLHRVAARARADELLAAGKLNPVLAGQAPRHRLNIDAEEADRSTSRSTCSRPPPTRASPAGRARLRGQATKALPPACSTSSSTSRATAARHDGAPGQGAYWDAEIKRADRRAAGRPGFTRKVAPTCPTRLRAKKLLAAPTSSLQFATHNAHIRWRRSSTSPPPTVCAWQPGDYEFQRLHGMGEPL